MHLSAPFVNTKNVLLAFGKKVRYSRKENTMTIIDVNGNERTCVKAFPDKNYPGYMRIEFKGAIRSHHEWYPIDEFSKNNPKLAYLTNSAPVVTEEVVGVVSSSTPTSITDKKRSWKENAYKGFPIWISRGLGEGQIRTVISNSHNTIHIDETWETKPNKTSQYVLSHNIHDPQPLENALPGI